MSDLSMDWEPATGLADRQVRQLLGATAVEPEREALARFLAGRDERPWRGAFASLAPAESAERGSLTE